MTPKSVDEYISMQEENVQPFLLDLIARIAVWCEEHE